MTVIDLVDGTLDRTVAFADFYVLVQVFSLPIFGVTGFRSQTVHIWIQDDGWGNATDHIHVN
jgi:hypothetical protein